MYAGLHCERKKCQGIKWSFQRVAQLRLRLHGSNANKSSKPKSKELLAFAVQSGTRVLSESLGSHDTLLSALPLMLEYMNDSKSLFMQKKVSDFANPGFAKTCQLLHLALKVLTETTS